MVSSRRWKTFGPVLWLSTGLALFFVLERKTSLFGSTAPGPKEFSVERFQRAPTNVTEDFDLEEGPRPRERYSERPDVLEVIAKFDPSLPPGWQDLRRGHLEAVAMLLELYPNHDLYFLARDAELLYDLLIVMTQNDSQSSGRVRLLNVSRANMGNRNIVAYLEQEGISTESLMQGQRVIFVDTGFSGTISRNLKRHFPVSLHPQLNTHLMASSNPNHPSTRVFLTSINPAAPELNPGSMQGSILSYEDMPRFTQRSNSFGKVKDRWEALGPAKFNAKGEKSDGRVNRALALQYQKDLKAYAESSEAVALFTKRRSQWKALRTLATVGDREQVIAELKRFLAEDTDDIFRKAMVLDLVEALRIHGFQTSQKGLVTLNIAPRELGLSVAPAEKSFSLSNKHQLIAKHPQWKSILEDPETGIEKLITSGNWAKLGAITDAIVDEEFQILLAQKLGAKKTTSEIKSFINMLIVKGDQKVLRILAQYTFSQLGTQGMEDLIQLLIEKGDQDVLGTLALFTFSQPHAKDMKDLLRRLVEKGDQGVLWNLAQYTFSQPHTKDKTDLLRSLIERGDEDTLWALDQFVFSEPHTRGLVPLQQALGILDPKKRRDFLNAELGAGDTHVTSSQAIVPKHSCRDLMVLILATASKAP